jgi:hypothetical protein
MDLKQKINDLVLKLPPVKGTCLRLKPREKQSLEKRETQNPGLSLKPQDPDASEAARCSPGFFSYIK